MSEPTPRPKTAGPNPVLKANIFSVLTWHWAQPFIRKGNKKTIEMEDLYDLVPRETAEHCERTWYEGIESQKKKNPGKPPSVFKLLMLTCGREMIFSFISVPFWLASTIAQVYVLKFLVELVGSDKRLVWWHPTILVLGMTASSGALSLSQQSMAINGVKAGLKMRSATSMAVFNKMLELKSVGLSGTSTGHMLNLITNDTQKLMDASLNLSFVSFIFVFFIVISLLAISEVGIAALPGVGVLFLSQPLLVSLAKSVGKIRIRAIKYTDARVQTIQGILNGVRVMKYNGWTSAFLARIQELRSTEIAWIRKAALIRSSGITLRNGVAPLASLVTFASYVALHNGSFSPSKAFAILGFYAIQVRVYAIGTAGVLSVGEGIVAINRIQRFLNLAVGKGNSSEEELAQILEIYPEAAAVVSHGTFLWQLPENLKAAAKASSKESAKAASKSKIPKRPPTKISPSGKMDGPGIGALRDIDFSISKGELVAVIGSVGSGKSSLLYALLGEMECVKGTFFMDKTVSYAPQQPWVINDTVQNNILLSSEFDEARYKKVVTACALDQDFLTFAAGDKTEIGERGINLSGGQKARISLARACYSSSKIVLLDDPLAAVDVSTAKHLMKHVLKDFLKGRTVIMVTHSKPALEICDRVFFLENGKLEDVTAKEGLIEKLLPLGDEIWDDEPTLGDETDQIDGVSLQEAITVSTIQLIRQTSVEMMRQPSSELKRQASIELIRQNSIRLMKQSSARVSRSGSRRPSFVEHGSRRRSFASGSIANQDAEVTEEPKPDGAVIVQEERAVGAVTWRTFLDYAKGSGLWFFIFVLIYMTITQAANVMVVYWVSIWVNGTYHLTTHLYVGLYAVLIGAMIFFNLSRSILFTISAMRAAKYMHNRLAESVLRSPILFFDQNPVGRIINRFSKDQSILDELLPLTLLEVFENFIAVFGVIVLLGISLPWFLLWLPPFAVALYYCKNLYVRVSREVKRLDSLSRSPIYAHFSQTLQGAPSVRAYQKQSVMHDLFRELIDANNRAYIMYTHTGRWLNIRIDFIVNISVTLVALLIVILRHSVSPGVSGAVLLLSIQLTGYFQYVVRMSTEAENYFTSVERNQAYATLPPEADANSPPGLISEAWPEQGSIEYVNYTMAYREDLTPVLNNLNFKVKPQEKIGIVGRTGAGKSSLTAALFRMVENSACSGSIIIDGIDTKRVGLDDLRLRLSIIPQDPVFFKGTLRSNLDPFERHSDSEIFEALAKVQLTGKIQSFKAGINTPVEENGDNFSVGQRQLICLARSLLRRSQIVVMDEATAAVDGETDQLIQMTMRSVFQNCTVLTIAHRIETIIDCDRVLVMGKGGKVVEFDSPANLLRRQRDSADSSTPSFADMVFQTGPTVSKALTEAAEEAERMKLAREEAESNQFSSPRFTRATSLDTSIELSGHHSF